MYNSLVHYSLGGKRKPANDPPNFVASNNTILMKEDDAECAISEKGEYILSCHYDNGGYLSNNYGSTFTQLNIPIDVRSCAVSGNGQYMLFGSGRIHRSVNYGNTFTAVSILQNWKRIRMSFDGKYCLASSNNVYLSTDFGATFTSIGYTSPTTYPADFDIAMSKTGQYMISIKKNLTNDSIRISSNYGASWTEKTLTGLTDFATSCAMSEDGQTAFIGSRTKANLYKITNLSNTSLTVEFIPNTSFINCAVILVSSDGLYIFISDSYNAKMYYSKNGGSSFTRITTITTALTTAAMTPDSSIIIGNNSIFNNKQLLISNA
jgi:hypothetical protein